MRSRLHQVRELGRIVRWKASQERFRDTESVGGAEKLRLSKPLVYVEGLGCFSESEVAVRFNLLINRLRR